jgi:hypothetical protein
MSKREKRPWSKNTDVWLSPQVVKGLEELEDFFGPRRTRAARYFLISMVAEEPWSKKKPDWERRNKYLQERPEGEKLVRLPLRLWDNLLRAVDVKAQVLNLSRSAFVRKVLTMAVDERLEWGDPCLTKMLKQLGLPRKKLPWEEEAKK